MLLNKTEQHQEEQGQMRFMTLNNVLYVCSNNAQPHIIFRRKFSGRSFLHVNYTGHTLPYS